MSRKDIVNQISQAIRRVDPTATAILYGSELATGVLVSPMIMLRKQWEDRPFKTPFYINDWSFCDTESLRHIVPGTLLY